MKATLLKESVDIKFKELSDSQNEQHFYDYKKRLKKSPPTHQVGHKIVSPKTLLSNNKDQIKDLLDELSKQYNVTPSDIAFVLGNILKGFDAWESLKK